jgi:hypothetical protein
VAPVDQVFPVELEDVKVAEPPEQNVVGPLVLIVGVAGTGFTVTDFTIDVEEQFPFETLTV